MLITKKTKIGDKYEYSFTTNKEFNIGEEIHVLTKEEGRTKKQNALFWSAMRELYNSGAYSFLNFIEDPRYPITFRQFAEIVKVEHGAGYDHYVWVTKDGYHGTSDEPPEFECVFIRGITKSTTRYTKKQFSEMLDSVKKWVREMGDIPEKISEILNLAIDVSF